MKDRLRAHFANPWRKSYVLDYVLLSAACFLMQVAHSAEGYAKVEASYLEDCEYAREISIVLQLTAMTIFFAYYTILSLGLIAFAEEFRAESTSD